MYFGGYVMGHRHLVWVGASALLMAFSVAGTQAGTAAADAGDSPAGVSPASSSPVRASSAGTTRGTIRSSRVSAVTRTRPAAHSDTNRARPLLSTPTATGQRIPNSAAAPSVESTVTSLQAQVSGDFNDLREWSNDALPAPYAEFVNGGLYLLRRLFLPTGKDVGLFGDAACVTSLDCSNKDLTGAQLDRQNLTGVTWTGASLRLANLSASDLSDADFSPAAQSGRSADLQGADFGSGKLANADFESANLANANLENAGLFNANLTNANLTNANLFTTGLNSANLTSANLTSANLFFASLISANLTNANLTNANLTSANLTSAKLAGATLTWVTWFYTTCPDGRYPPPGGCST